MGFSDAESAGSDVGAEVTEVESRDSDYGDGDGVNDFDETYNEMNDGNVTLEYLGGTEKADVPEDSENKSNEITETAVDSELSGFDDSVEPGADSKVMSADNAEANRPSDMTTGESVAGALSDFDDGGINNNETLNTVDVSDRNETEKTAVFENVSYHQGQNDLGAYGTCGPTSIANSLNRVTDSSDYTENDVLHNAMDNNLCSKSDDPFVKGGTTTEQVVSIIDNVKDPESNIHVEVYENDKALSVDDLASRLDDPDTVAMVGVDSATLWDKGGDVASTGLFQHNDAPSDHWITVDGPVRDADGNVTGFNVIDSGGGVDFVDRDKFESMYQGDESHTVSDPTAILISNKMEETR